MNKDVKRLLDKAEELGWNVKVYEDSISFGMFSSAGQDFSFEIPLSDNTTDIIKAIYNYYENYDASEEVCLWLDETGHGTNGAPSDLGDLYEDMKECESNVYSLYNELSELESAMCLEGEEEEEENKEEEVLKMNKEYKNNLSLKEKYEIVYKHMTYTEGYFIANNESDYANAIYTDTSYEHDNHNLIVSFDFELNTCIVKALTRNDFVLSSPVMLISEYLKGSKRKQQYIFALGMYMGNIYTTDKTLKDMRG